MSFEFNPASVVPQAPVEVAFEPKSIEIPATHAESLVTHRSMAMNEFEAEADRMKSYPRDEIVCELDLLEEPRWMAGLWGDENGGWRDARTNTFLSFDDARQLIEARIKELGLSAGLVHAFPHSHSSITEHQRFWHLDFASQMERFR